MLFNSYDFLFIFLPFTIALYFVAPRQRKNAVITIASFIFYGYWNFKFCALLLFSICVNFLLGKKIYESDASKRKFLILSLAINIGLLGFFKYANFFIDSFIAIMPFFHFGTLKIILPIGISFFTFQGMSYALDIYRGNAIPANKAIDFACYISMFPQLVAGPIVRFNQIAEQLYFRRHTIEKTAYGVRRFIVGLGKKVLVADVAANIAEQQLHHGSIDNLNVWIGIIAFSLQIYFDFSGYSDMAIGLGRIFGFRLPENFNYPYNAKGIYDFWRRWHMTLSAWLKDYIYIPLGGSRCSTGSWVINIMVTFLLCGLWHGAAWTFVAWGGYHGILVILERPFRKNIQVAPSWIVIPATNILVIIGWVFFKASSFQECILWLKLMFGIGSGKPSQLPSLSLISILFLLQIGCWAGWFKMEKLYQGIKWAEPIIVAVFLASLISILGANVSQFLYYQF